MPTRTGVALILLFWLATTGWVAYRDLLPRLLPSGPPPIAIEFADEAGQFIPVRWVLTRDGRKIGSLTTEMKYIDADATFRFTHTYREIALDVMGVPIYFPEVTETTRVTRTGALRGQSLVGKITVAKVFTARADLRGHVENGQLSGRVEVTAPGLEPIDRTFGPVPVEEGRVLNPLQPVNRLANVRGGLQWRVPEVNPLRDAVAALAKASGLPIVEPDRDDLIAEVGAATQELMYRGEPTACWVIEYRRTEPVARTWVKAADGKVLRQEAFGFGERVALERDD